ncbi:MAG: hypothetical protein ACK44W_07435 [Planctomycetota bacterium]
MSFWIAAALWAQGADTDAETWYRLCLRAETTSDWLALELRNVSGFWVDRQEVRTGAGVKVVEGPLRLAKPPGDTHPACLSAVVYLELSGQGNPELEVTRGSLGRADIEITGVGRFTHDVPTGEGTNRRVFPLDARAIRALGAKPLDAQPRPVEKLALAFYYPWYGSPNGPSGRWVHWEPDRGHASRHTPILGFYDSQDERILRKHIEWAQEAGLDGFIVSWWGPGSFEDRVLRKLIPLAAERNFRVTAYLERSEGSASLGEDRAYLLKQYGDSSAWLRIGAQPVLFVYTRVVESRTAEEFERSRGDAILVLDTFGVSLGRAGGGLHTYCPAFQDLEALRILYRGARAASRRYGLVFAATVVPGYDDTVLRHPGGRRSRERGRLYDAFWETALGADPDWILVCSWNEWHEGTEIEPSVENGDRELRRTAEWIRRWKGAAENCRAGR